MLTFYQGFSNIQINTPFFLVFKCTKRIKVMKKNKLQTKTGTNRCEHRFFLHCLNRRSKFFQFYTAGFIFLSILIFLEGYLCKGPQ